MRQAKKCPKGTMERPWPGICECSACRDDCGARVCKSIVGKSAPEPKPLGWAWPDTNQKES